MKGMLFLQRMGPYLLVFALGVLGNFFFTGELLTRSLNIDSTVWGWHQIIASIFVLVTIGLSVWIFGKRDHYEERDRGVRTRAPEVSSSFWWKILPCGVLYLSSVVIYLVWGETSVVRWCWLLSGVAFVVVFLREVKFSKLYEMPSWEILLLALLLGAGFTVRYTDLTQIPYHVDNDVSIMGLFSKKLVDENNWRWVGMAPTEHQYSEHQFIALSMRLFGVNHYGLVMLSVISGTGVLAITFFLGKLLFNRWVGFIATAFLAFNYVHIHFSRILFGPLATFFRVFASLFFLLGLRRGNVACFGLAGLGVGLGLLDYYSGRIGPVLAACIFVLWLFNRGRYPHVTGRHWLIALIGMLVAFGPNLAYSIKKTDSFHGRGSTVIIWTEPAWKHLTGKYKAEEQPLVVLKEQVKRTLLAPFYFPDESTICHLRKPMMGALAAVCLMLGAGFFLRRLRDLSFDYVLVWIGLTFLLGGVLTIDPPFWPHLNIAIPALCLVAGVGAERFFRRWMLEGGTFARVGIPVVVSGLLVFTGIHQWEVYANFATKHAGGRIHSMRQIEKLTPDYQVYLVSKNISWNQETFQFFCRHVRGADLPQQELLSNQPVIKKPTAFFVFEDADPQCVDVLMKAYPGASQKLVFDGWMWPVFRMILVFPADFVEQPQAYPKGDQHLMSSEGWRLVAGVVLFGILMASMSLQRELKFPSGAGPEDAD